MFNYTKEVIINNAEKVAVKDGELRIPRAANYKIKNILEGKVFVTYPEKEAKAKLTIKVPAFDSGKETIRLTLFLSTPNVELAEFGTPCWQDFGKPIVIEVKNEKKAVENAARLRKAIKLSAGEYLEVEDGSDATIVVNPKEVWLTFQDVTLADFEFDADGVEVFGTELTNKSEKDAAISDDIYIKPAKVPVGSAEWMIENLRLPTVPNRRYAPLYADETPIRGEEYTQFVFKYVARHNVPGGLSGVDQCVDSITSHVFYVREGEVDKAFKAAIDKVATAAPITGEEGSAKTAPVASMNPYSAGAEVADVAAAKAAADDVAKKLAAIASVETEDVEVKKIIAAAATV